jgi:membrane protein
MERFLKCLFRGVARIVPDCVTLGQAIAFNTFLAFFPALLLLLGMLSSTNYFHEAVRELPDRLRLILPPGSEDVVMQYFVRRGIHTGRWISLGLGGVLFAGTQVMAGYIEGFRIIEGDPVRHSYWRVHLRGLLLVCLTMIPSMAVVILTVFGKQVRGWVIRQVGLPQLVHNLGFIFYGAFVFVLAMGVLVLIYRIGRPGHRGFRTLFPGAAVATVFWWAVDIFLGAFIRRMPYNVVYGGLAAAIGLLIWMYLTAIVVLLGAAFNAEYRESRLVEAAPQRQVAD